MTQEQLEAINTLPIKWPVRFDHLNDTIFDSAMEPIVLLCLSVNAETGEFLAACLNALHKEPERFNQLLNE